ncbi:MAG TPA: hypothetical protein VMO52_05320 [Acidimicrobiia bacterium]|nr:hypothetical protein [Acidimicrobiia bacterium]
MQTKNVLYAAVGAPVVAARKVSGTVGSLRNKINVEAGDYTKKASKTVDEWAKEGEKLVSRVADNEKIEELASRVDLDQAKEQVGKLRTQLEDMLDTWRSSFRPEKTVTKVEVTETTTPAAKTSAASTSVAKRSTATKPAAKTAVKKPAAKASTAKKPAAKKPAAKSTSTKAAKAS